MIYTNRFVTFAHRVLFAVVLCLCLRGPAAADQILIIDPKQSKITGRINYSVVGQYHAEFLDYQGQIVYDEEDHHIKSVRLEIQTDSITSKHPTLDRIVKSRQILDTDQFPIIVFDARHIRRDEFGYAVTGQLTMHGVTRDLVFTFESEEQRDDHGQLQIQAQGQWILERKGFEIIWHPFLDKGGLFVGNHITVDWSITAVPTQIKGE